MTASETLILATYFFVLVILAVYGWHRYYLVYLYMKNKGKQPVPAGPMDKLPAGHDPAPDLQRDVRRGSADRRRLPDRIIRASCSRSRSSTTRPTRRAGVAEQAVRRNAAKGIDITYLHRTDRTGYKAGALEAGMKVAKGEFIAIFDADFIPTDGLPAAARCRSSSIRRSRWSRRAGDTSIRTTRCSRRSSRSCSTVTSCSSTAAATAPGYFFNFNGTAGIWRRDGDRRCGRLAARHADRGSRSQLPCAAPRLAVRLPAGSDRAGRSAGRDELVQVAAAPLGEGVDPDLPQAAAAHPAVERCRSA